jgi:hypothetical protein
VYDWPRVIFSSQASKVQFKWGINRATRFQASFCVPSFRLMYHSEMPNMASGHCAGRFWLNVEIFYNKLPWTALGELEFCYSRYQLVRPGFANHWNIRTDNGGGMDASKAFGTQQFPSMLVIF